jgi:selenocysteine lyase/cysteine desulfurase
MSVLSPICELDIVGADLKTELSDGRVVPFAHLDHAASAPCLRAAADAVRELLPRYGSVHRGTGLRSCASTYAYDKARESVAEFVGTRPGDALMFTRNTTAAVRAADRALCGDDRRVRVTE